MKSKNNGALCFYPAANRLQWLEAGNTQLCTWRALLHGLGLKSTDEMCDGRYSQLIGTIKRRAADARFCFSGSYSGMLLQLQLPLLVASVPPCFIQSITATRHWEKSTLTEEVREGW
ncbi:hypothetical protein CHARACLAT_009272 [Characodon lateralis]|uniref:Uncharacterized protein n=1 Tax=Characodon lateralis TaxID=208331 RepID=A0ABU7EV15_9TELE|nr:hypothetical protein [Characodon lateralis]